MTRRIGFSDGARGTASVWDRHLVEGEQILWQGQPGFGFALNSSLIKTLAAVGIGIAILGPSLYRVESEGLGMDLLTIPVIDFRITPFWFISFALGWTVIWGLGQAITTPFFKQYMLSSNRAFIRRSFLFKRVKSYPLSPHKVLEYDGKPNGSIIFATESRRADSGKKRSFPVGFMYIDDAQPVYEKMVDVQLNNLHEQVLWK